MTVIDPARFPMLTDPSNPPTCGQCGSALLRFPVEATWFCTKTECDHEGETDAELDNRLTSAAEAAFERVQASVCQ